MEKISSCVFSKMDYINKFLVHCSYVKDDGTRQWFGRVGACCNFLRDFTRNGEGCKNCIYHMGTKTCVREKVCYMRYYVR